MLLRVWLSLACLWVTVLTCTHALCLWGKCKTAVRREDVDKLIQQQSEESARRRQEHSKELARQRQHNTRQREDHIAMLDRQRQEHTAMLDRQRQDNNRQRQEHSEAMARLHRRYQLMDLCKAVCVTDWGQWSRCTRLCGGGRQNRYREYQRVGQCSTLSDFQCPHSTNQTRECNSGCPHGGFPDAKKNGCRCPTGKTGTCCETLVSCPYLPAPSNGLVQGTGVLTYQAVLTYTCNERFTLVGHAQRRCGESGRWSGSTPICKRVRCTMPVENRHVVILNPDSTGYNFGDEIFYICEDGYELRGPAIRTCRRDEGTQGKLSGYDPTCRPVDCGDPGIPSNSQRNGTIFTYGGIVTYSCNVGYHLQGSNVMRCLSTGRWVGTVPHCQEISCDDPMAPQNGDLVVNRQQALTRVSFLCNSGYLLDGNLVLECSGHGEWNGTEPICKPVPCDTPIIPDHGSKDGSEYTYQNNVTYQCFDGYILQGERIITCEETGEWSAEAPSCEACPISTYMAQRGNSTDKEVATCVPCPPHSHTVTQGSTTIQHCICDEGYLGKPGGTCTEIDCPQLEAPVHGSMDECQVTVGHNCSFHCDAGHIMERGSSVRTCQKNGQWDGKESRCAPCKINSYKSDERSCLPCPRNSHTDAEAQTLDGCVCDKGYQGPPGGPCEDVNECEDNGGRGSCEDSCENFVGSYRCLCSIPGYGINPKNGHTCIVEEQCQNLTEAEAPANGGLVCHWYYERNSQQCAARCNEGYEFPSRINEYEFCGPQSAYTWTFQREDPNAVFHPCVEEFFPGFRTEANSTYFTRACNELTEEEQIQVKESFAETLNQKGVCQKRQTKVCEIKDMAIICGRRTLRRRKRGIMEELTSLDLAFNINAFQVKDKPKDCPVICRLLRIPDSHCTQLCIPTYKRFLRAAVEYARRQMQGFYRNQDTMRFSAANREFEPEENGFSSSEVISECKPGHAEHDGSCVPCERGSYYSNETQECEACPMETYQLFEAQTVCVPCPEGSTTHTNGSLFCTVCADNTWGPMCERSCECIHGKCDPVTGECLCENGWEGDHCDTDTPGCRDGGCFGGVICEDVPAPGSGFHCGPCPPGYSGDGQTCVPTSPAQQCQYQHSEDEGTMLFCGTTPGWINY